MLEAQGSAAVCRCRGVIRRWEEQRGRPHGDQERWLTVSPEPGAGARCGNGKRFDCRFGVLVRIVDMDPCSRSLALAAAER